MQWSDDVESILFNQYNSMYENNKISPLKVEREHKFVNIDPENVWTQIAKLMKIKRINFDGDLYNCQIFNVFKNTFLKFNT